MITRADPGLFQHLEQSGINVVSIYPANMEDMHNTRRISATFTGNVARADQMVGAFEPLFLGYEELSRSMTLRKRVFLEAVDEKMKTVIANAVATAGLKPTGGINMAADAPLVRRTDIPFFGKEPILSMVDEFDVYLSQSGDLNRGLICRGGAPLKRW